MGSDYLQNTLPAKGDFMLSVKPFRQKPGFCGVASLKMVLDYFCFEISEKELIELTGATTRKGTSLEGIKKAAQRLGFDFYFKDNADFSDIKFYLDKKIPAMVDWFSTFGGYSEGHFSVAVGLDKKFIYLQDPEIARVRKMERADFLRVWFDFEGDYIKSKNNLILRRLIIIRR